MTKQPLALYDRVRFVDDPLKWPPVVIVKERADNLYLVRDIHSDKTDRWISGDALSRCDYGTWLQGFVFGPSPAETTPLDTHRE